MRERGNSENLKKSKFYLEKEKELLYSIFEIKDESEE